PRPSGAGGPGDGRALPGGGGQGGETGELVLAALAQGEPVDAAAGELVEDLVGGQLGVEDQQARITAGGVLPVVSEGDDLAGLSGLGDVGVGVDHLAAGVVLGEERQDRAGALGAAGHVVRFQPRVVGGGGEGVEVSV